MHSCIFQVKWWKQKRGGGACQAKGGGGGVAPLGLANVAGVFLVTMVGCGIAALFAVLEFLYGTRQAAKVGRSKHAGIPTLLVLFSGCWSHLDG